MLCNSVTERTVFITSLSSVSFYLFSKAKNIFRSTVNSSSVVVFPDQNSYTKVILIVAKVETVSLFTRLELDIKLKVKHDSRAQLCTCRLITCSTGDARLQSRISPGLKCVRARDGRDSRLSTYNNLLNQYSPRVCARGSKIGQVGRPRQPRVVEVLPG